MVRSGSISDPPYKENKIDVLETCFFLWFFEHARGPTVTVSVLGKPVTLGHLLNISLSSFLLEKGHCVAPKETLQGPAAS